MAKKIQKMQASTQKFTNIDDIVDNVVVLSGGNACMVIEVSSTNFALLSTDEQEAKIGAYASFLNSLTFPIQIVINNRRVNITSYISLLESEIEKVQDDIVSQYMQLYKSFVQQLVKQNIVLDKRFYIVVPYSYLEVGAVKTISSAAKQSNSDNDITGMKATLHSKADGIRNQLGRINLQTKILEKEELLKLFHQMYNPEDSQTAAQNTVNISAPIIGTDTKTTEEKPATAERKDK